MFEVVILSCFLPLRQTLVRRSGSAIFTVLCKATSETSWVAEALSDWIKMVRVSRGFIHHNILLRMTRDLHDNREISYERRTF